MPPTAYAPTFPSYVDAFQAEQLALPLLRRRMVSDAPPNDAFSVEKHVLEGLGALPAARIREPEKTTQRAQT